MSAKGPPGWYRRNDGYDHDAELLKRRTAARANGMFDEFSERPAFERFFRDSRCVFPDDAAKTFQRLSDGTYAGDSVQRHWHTWQMSVGAGRLLPKFNATQFAIDSAVERIAAETGGAS